MMRYFLLILLFWLPLSHVYANEAVVRKLDKPVASTVAQNYLVYLPVGYQQQKAWPTLLFLHGSGEKGDDLDITRGIPPLFEDEHTLPFIVIVPQLRFEDVSWPIDYLDAVLEDAVQNFAVDKEQLYLTGLSLGGFGAIRYASARPDTFAAVAPIAGGDPNYPPPVSPAQTPLPVMKNILCRLNKQPVWIYHGAKDPLVPLALADEVYQTLKGCHPNVHYSVFPNHEHDVWTPVYNDPAFYNWLLAQKREHTKMPHEYTVKTPALKTGTYRFKQAQIDIIQEGSQYTMQLHNFGDDVSWFSLGKGRFAILPFDEHAYSTQLGLLIPTEHGIQLGRTGEFIAD